MQDSTQRIREHYDAADGTDGMLGIVEEILGGMPAGMLTSTDLAAFDQFHVGGLPATKQFMALLDPQPGMTIFDAGSGFGGPSRFVAETYDCRVVGVDITPAYVAVAQRLSERTRTANRIGYRTGDLLDLDDTDASYDAMYTQHVVMNIRERVPLYRELRRVLKPGARFGFHDILAADDQPAPDYPLPWADSAEISTLLTESETRRALLAAGFDVMVWNDVTADATAAAVRMQSNVGPGPTLGTIVGPRFAERFANLRRTLENGRLRVVMGVGTARP
ncbi:MAG: methyltransferase domain-containing protein [Gemmatimonadaceae bacterium]|nr:methyltransferase domain-containing protein [Gemmatimonadaceae bacterium]